MSSPKRRIETDVNIPRLRQPTSRCAPPRRLHERLMSCRLMSDYECSSSSSTKSHLNRTPLTPCRQEFYVRFKGPEEKAAPFQGGLWKIHVELPDQYPYKSPSIGFVNRIFHPNIDELPQQALISGCRSGSVCLDVINQTWSPMYDMINIFEVFLPQLLRYPNPTDPLNGEAAALLMREPKSYDAKVKEYVQKYANKDTAEDSDKDNDDDDEMSSVGSYESGDEDEAAGNMEDI
ncbi:hypothetical protein LEMA_P071150.1 [Plenodomus lingam JN3]|uniref:UBC core domain-containing protein n=1 Tax=Leptosphaeria maculans (strain JN3 / isolate v23.1.3 / race Av1-4-5-6-7-8) TaxID=985895 RepID=E4ZK12_LEPMJ|nr:hypothetical protein LEMA_P071150.1 [Plenodomus lingam JN3]CBX91607.1 hypothetical protein LEMA_P071150.1 [Plenodomus lingam JN3]